MLMVILNKQVTRRRACSPFYTYINDQKPKHIPLNACLQFWHPAVASFVQKIKQLSSTNIVTLNLQNKFVKRRQKNEKL